MSKLLPIYSAEQLFQFCKIDPQFPDLRQHIGLDARVFDALCKPLLHQFAELVQLAPASEAHHHAGPGGLLIHTFDVTSLALRIRRGYQLPIGGSLLDISTQRHLWTYAIFLACVLHDIGKLSANTRLRLVMKDGSEQPWTPHSGPMTQQKNLKGYRVEFRKTPYQYHAHLALTHWDLIPKHGRTWLIEANNIMAELVAWLYGDKFESGTIGEIVEAADRQSTAKNLQIPADQRFSDAIPVIDRYLKIIRGWIRDGDVKINVNGGMGWVDEHGHLYMVCRSLADKLITECDSQGLKGLPQDPVRVYDILQEHGYALPTEDGKAIWPIRVKTATFEHKFTCLKFDGRRLTLPSRRLRPLDGRVEIVGADAPEAAEHPQETAALTQATGKPEAAPVTQETAAQAAESNKGDNQTAETAETENDMPSDTEILEALAIQDAQENAPKAAAKSRPDTAPIRDTVEESPATAANADAAPARQEAGATTDAVSVIRNLNPEAPDTGQKFLGWLQRGLLEKTIVINNPTAEVHIVDEGVFLLAPAIFKTFLRLHGLPEDKHKNLSKKFGKLRKHVRNGDFNIHPYWVSSSNRATKINGWLLPFSIIYEHDHPVPKPNKYIKKNLNTE